MLYDNNERFFKQSFYNSEAQMRAYPTVVSSILNLEILSVKNNVV